MKCPKCGKDLTGNGNFCPNCGAEIDMDLLQKEEAIQNEKQTEDNKTLIRELKKKKDNEKKANFLVSLFGGIGSGICRFWKKGKLQKLITILLVLAILSLFRSCASNITGNTANSSAPTVDENNSNENTSPKEISQVEDENKTEEPNNDSTAPTETNSSDSVTSEELVDGMRPSFKEAVDSTEAFFDSYCEFMKKYEASDDTTSMLVDYTEFTAKYAAAMEKMDKLDDDANETELNYYINAMNRINAKLAEIAQ